MPPSITTWATCTPLAPYSRAMLCAIMRRPALAAANWAKPGLPRRLPEAPVKITVPRPERDQPAGRLAPDQEAGKAADAPEVLEQLRRDLAEVDHLVVAGVEDDDVGRVAPAAGRHGAIEQGDDLLFARRIGGNGLGAAAGGDDAGHHLLDLGGRTAGDQDVIALPGEATADRRADALLGADAHDDCGRLTHGAAPGLIASITLPPMRLRGGGWPWPPASPPASPGSAS